MTPIASQCCKVQDTQNILDIEIILKIELVKDYILQKNHIKGISLLWKKKRYKHGMSNNIIMNFDDIQR